MNIRRLAIGILMHLVATGAIAAQGVNLTEAPLAQQAVRNELTMELDGKMTVKQDGKDVTFVHKASARHVFIERFLEVNGAVADKAARFYTTAESVITFNNDAGPKRTLRDDRRFMVAHRHKDRIVAYSVNGTLSREETELTEHLDTLSISGLLPGKQVAVGATWPVANSVVAALGDFDGLAVNKLEGKLEAVEGNTAKISIQGTADGINLGAQVKVLVNARLDYDTKAQRVVSVEWREEHARQQGPITPAMAAGVTLRLKRMPIDVPEQLNDNALVKVPGGKTPPPELTTIRHTDPRYILNHGRDWHVTSPDGSPQLVLRLLDRGQFIGQAVLTSLKKVDPKKVMTIGDFADEMRGTPGWTETKEIERKELPAGPNGHAAVYRVAATGDLDGIRTTQYFYLLVGAKGDQLIVTFSIDPQQVERLGARDLELIREITFP